MQSGIQKMKTSIITVCYNSEDTIAETLSSVATQTHTCLEHIIIDGGSTDATLEQIQLHGQHVAKLISEPDKGIYDAMNKGLAKATGDVICFLNADDRYATCDVIADIAAQMERESLDALIGDVAFFRAKAPDKLVRRYSSSRFTPGRLSWGWMPSHPALFIRREIYERVGAFRTDFKIAGDYEWIARAFKDGQLRYQYKNEILVRMQMGGVSTRGWRNTLLLNQEVLRACRDNGIPTNWFQILSKYPAKLLEYVRL
jgi:glycosyltransferase involved in cell wall biosynthesis